MQFLLEETILLLQNINLKNDLLSTSQVLRKSQGNLKRILAYEQDREQQYGKKLPLVLFQLIFSFVSQQPLNKVCKTWERFLLGQKTIRWDMTLREVHYVPQASSDCGEIQYISIWKKEVFCFFRIKHFKVFSLQQESSPVFSRCIEWPFSMSPTYICIEDDLIFTQTSDKIIVMDLFGHIITQHSLQIKPGFLAPDLLSQVFQKLVDHEVWHLCSSRNLHFDSLLPGASEFGRYIPLTPRKQIQIHSLSTSSSFIVVGQPSRVFLFLRKELTYFGSFPVNGHILTLRISGSTVIVLMDDAKANEQKLVIYNLEGTILYSRAHPRNGFSHIHIAEKNTLFLMSARKVKTYSFKVNQEGAPSYSSFPRLPLLVIFGFGDVVLGCSLKAVCKNWYGHLKQGEGSSISPRFFFVSPHKPLKSCFLPLSHIRQIKFHREWGWHVMESNNIWRRKENDEGYSPLFSSKQWDPHELISMSFWTEDRLVLGLSNNKVWICDRDGQNVRLLPGKGTFQEVGVQGSRIFFTSKERLHFSIVRKHPPHPPVILQCSKRILESKFPRLIESDDSIVVIGTQEGKIQIFADHYRLSYIREIRDQPLSIALNGQCIAILAANTQGELFTYIYSYAGQALGKTRKREECRFICADSVHFYYL
jgi:hypothetical protein